MTRCGPCAGPRCSSPGWSSPRGRPRPRCCRCASTGSPEHWWRTCRRRSPPRRPAAPPPRRPAAPPPRRPAAPPPWTVIVRECVAETVTNPLTITGGRADAAVQALLLELREVLVAVLALGPRVAALLGGPQLDPADLAGDGLGQLGELEAA